MHADEVETDPSLVRRLIAGQFPQWAGLPVEPVLPRGTDNANYRLGKHLLVRLPRRDVNVAPLAKELEWLPLLGPRLPLAIPQPVEAGEPGAGFPFPWAIFTWLDGETATVDAIDAERTAEDVAAFVLALRGLPPEGAPRGHRRRPLREFDAKAREAIANLGADHLALWDDALAAPEWEGPPTWCHGDLDLRNVLFAHGRPCGVLDFGCIGIDDPATDDAAAFKLLPAHARGAFFAALGADDASIARARGWTLYQCAMAIPYYTPENNPALYFEAERWLIELGCAPTRSVDPRA